MILLLMLVSGLEIIFVSRLKILLILMEIGLMGFGGKSVDETEQGIVVEMVVSAAQVPTDSKRSLDDYAIQDYMFWSKDCKWVWCMRHLYSPETFEFDKLDTPQTCLLYTSPSPRDRQKSRMPSSA